MAAGRLAATPPPHAPPPPPIVRHPWHLVEKLHPPRAKLPRARARRRVQPAGRSCPFGGSARLPRCAARVPCACRATHLRLPPRGRGFSTSMLARPSRESAPVGGPLAAKRVAWRRHPHCCHKQTRNAPEISRLPGRKCAPRCVLSAPLTTWAAPLATWAAWGTGARCTTARKDAVIPRTRSRIHEPWSVRLAPCPSAPRGTDTRRALSLHRRCQQWPRPRPRPPPLSWWPGSTSVRPPLSRRSATGRPPALAPRWWPTRCRRSARPRTQVRARAARRGARWPVLSLIACTRP